MPGLGFLKQPTQILLWIKECLCNSAKAGFLYLVVFSMVVSPLQPVLANSLEASYYPANTIAKSIFDEEWGVLTMNTDKDVYQAGDYVRVDFGVLDKAGEMACDVNLNLTIEHNGKYYQNYSTNDGNIKVNEECNAKAKTNKPDLETGFVATEPGNYALILSAETKSGRRQIKNDLLVTAAKTPFTIQRNTQTRIYPKEIYTVDIIVSAQEDFDGIVQEGLPSSFELVGTPTDSELDEMLQLQKILGMNVQSINPHKIHKEGTRQYIDFSISLKRGQKITLSYSYDAPDKSPDMFTLGPAEFFSGNRNETVYKEQRAWYIANDAVQTYQGTFEKATTTGSQVITGVGFQPKAIIFFWSRQDTVGFASSVMSSGFGFTTGASAQRSLAIAEDYNTSTSNSGRYKSDTNSIVVLSNGNPVVAATATLVSLDVDGFTLNWGLNENRHDPVNFLALGGDDISDVAIGTFNNSVSGASTGTQSVTGVGFKPDFVMLASGFTGNPNTATAGAQISVGWASASTSQAAFNFRTRDGISGNANKDSQQRTDAVALLYIATSGVDAVADFRSMDSDGFTIHWSNAPASASTPFYYLAIKGGQHKVGNFFKPAATGYATTSTVGFQPRALMTGSIGKASSTSSQSPAAFMIGAAASSTAQGVVWSEGKGNPSRVGNYLSTSSLVSVGTTTTTSFAVSGEAKLTSFNSNGFTINWTTITDSNSREVVYWAIGDNPPISVSGNVYSDEGSTGLAASRTIKLSVNGAAPVSTTTVAGSGQYNFLNVPASPGSVVTVFLDGASEKASVVTKVADTIADITGLNLYQDRVIVRHENGGPVTIANLNKYDGDNDSDIQFTATTSPTTSLTISDGAKLIVWTGKTLTPGGSISTSPSSASSTADGDITIQSSATLNMETNQLSVGGDFSNYSVYSKTTNQTTVFTATGSGFLIYNGASAFENLVFNGAGGNWSFDDGTTGDSTAWYNTSWTYRKTITIDHNKVASSTGETYSNFPILVSLTDSNLKASSSSGHVGRADGGDILFTSSDGITKLNHELEKYSPTTGETVAWVKVPSLSTSTDTTLYMYYGNSSAANQATTTGVWDSSYKGVWHMSETSGQHRDSTSNGNNSSSITVAVQGSAAGRIDGSDDFESSSASHSVAVPDSSSLDLSSSFTISAWIKPESLVANTYDTILGKGNGYYIALLDNYYGEDDELEFGYLGSVPRMCRTSSANISTGSLYYLTGVFDDTGNTLAIYVNGLAQDSLEPCQSTDSPVTNNSDFVIGSYLGIGEWFDGIIDEARVSAIVRSADWIATEYNNQNSANTFYTVGNESQQSLTTTVSGDLTVTAGTITGTTSALVQGGDVTGNGAINLTGGTFTLTGTGNFGGSSDWFFNNLTFGAGGTSTTTGVGTATVTVGSTLTNYSGHTFNAGPKTWALTGVGTPFVNNGTFIASSSTVSYRATSGTTTPASVMYNNLDFAPASGAPTFYLDAPANPSPSDWYNSSWPYRKAITIDRHNVASSTGETYSNFPVLVSLTDSNLKASSSSGHVGRADGGDILFTSSDGITKLNHELELYSSSTGETIAWVKVPSLSTSTDTTLYIYYGNASASNQATTTGVWDSNYKAVLHLDDHDTITLPDSTSVGTDGTKDASTYPASYPDRTLAKIGYGLDSNSESDYFNFADTEAWTWDPLTQSRTFSLWFKPTADFSDEANNFGFFKTYSADHHPYYVGWTKSAGASYLGVFVYNDAYNSLIGAAYAPWTMSFDQWYKLDFVAKPTGSVIYVNGQALAMSDIGWNTTAVSNPSNIDFRTEYSRGQGVVDEMRVSHSARSQDWIKTEYNNQSSTSTFMSFGSESGYSDAATNVSITGSLTISAGNLTGQASVAVSGGSVTGNGTINLTGGTFTLTGTGNFGGNSEWFFNNLTFGAGGTSTTTGIGTATVTVSSTLTNYPNHTFNAGPKPWVMTASGTPFVNNGVFIASSSTFSYRATTGTTTPANVTYNNLDFAPASGSPVFSLDGSSSSIPTSWYSTGGTWSYRKAITIDHTKVASSTGETYVNFPMLVSLTDASLKASSSAGHVGRADGGDILFTSSDGTTKLSHEIEKYSSTTGETIAWVKVPSLSTSTDTTLYIYYGNASASNQATTTGVWDSSYKGVWHMNQVSGNFTDSTSYVNTGTAFNIAYNASGQIGSAAIWNGTDSSVNVGSDAELDDISTLTYSAWVNPYSLGQNWFFGSGIVFDKTAGSGFKRLYMSNSIGNSDWRTAVESSGTTYMCTAPDEAVQNTLQYITVLYDNGSDIIEIYKNGTLICSSSNGAGASITEASGSLFIGNNTDGTGAFDGLIDEARVSAIVRSADWIKTEYNNQSSTSTFISLGNEESANGTSTSSAIVILGNLSIGGSGAATVDVYTHDTELDINGSLSIGSGDTFLASDSATTTIGTNLIIDGTFIHNGGTLLFDTSSTSTITSAANITFYNIIVATTGKSLVFQKHTNNVPLFTVAGQMTLTGTLGSKINLQSDTPGSQWLVHFNSAQTGMTYVNVKDSGCDISSASVTNTLLTDQGNNGACWGWATLVLNQGPGGNSTNGFSGGGTVQTGGGQTGGSSTNGGSGVTAWGPVEISANNHDGSEVEGTSWMADGYLGQDYVDMAGYHAGWTFVLPDIPANATIQKMYLRAYAIGASVGNTLNFYLKTQNVDPANRALWSTSNRPSQASYVNAQSIQSVTLANNAWYFGEYDTKPINLAADLQGLITNYGAIVAGDSLNIAILWASVGGWVGFEDYSNAGTHHAQLYIEWRVVTGAQTGGGQSGGGATP